jgi:hypothetical protein
MEGAVADLATALGSAYTFVYASIGSPSTPETWIDDPPGGKGQATTDPNHASAMVTALNTVVTNQGPFWGILGYSQGAASVPVYLSQVADGTFQAAIMFCGYLTTTHTGLLNRVNQRAPFGNIPALIWLSTADTVIIPDLSRNLEGIFTSPTIVEADPGPGHVVVPNSDPTFNSVVEWIQTGRTTSVRSATTATGSGDSSADSDDDSEVGQTAIIIIVVVGVLVVVVTGMIIAFKPFSTKPVAPAAPAAPAASQSGNPNSNGKKDNFGFAVAR